MFAPMLPAAPSRSAAARPAASVRGAARPALHRL